MQTELINSEEAKAKTSENLKKLDDSRVINYMITLEKIKNEIKIAISKAIANCEFSCNLNIGDDRLQYGDKYYDWNEEDIIKIIKEIKEYIEQFNYKCEVSKSKFFGYLVDIKIDWSK